MSHFKRYQSHLLLILSAFIYTQNFAQQKFRVIAKDTNSLRVEATLQLKNNTIKMVLRGTSDELPNGTADFIKDLVISDMNGNRITHSAVQKGKWMLNNNSNTINISYNIRLDHEKHSWDNYGGVDAVSYKNGDGIFGTGYSFLIVPDSTDAACTIKFQIPVGWKAATPWQQVSPTSFITNNTDDLLNNCFFIGTHLQKTLKVGSFEVEMAIGGNLKGKFPLFEQVLSASINQYWKIFKQAAIKKYLVILNEGGMTDGDAFNNSFDQLIKGEVNKDGIISWGNILAHETFHLWNGISMYSSEQNEWFKEGLTEYMSVKTLRKAGLINDALLLKKLESFHSRYWMASNITSRDVTLKDAGDNKNANVFLVYGGGCLVAFMLDVEIRKATGNKKGIEDFLFEMYGHYGLPGKPYSMMDVKEIACKVAGKPLNKLFESFVERGKELVPNPIFYDCGLGISSFAEEHYLYFKNPTAKYNPLFKSLFIL